MGDIADYYFEWCPCEFGNIDDCTCGWMKKLEEQFAKSKKGEGNKATKA